MFRNDLTELMDRTRFFHESAGAGSALVEVMSVDEIDTPEVDLTLWNFPGDMKKYLDNAFGATKAYWQSRKSIEDDRIPSITAWYGIAEHSAYVGGDVVFEKETSYHKPFLTDWDDLDKLVLDVDNPWRRMLDDGFMHLQELCSDSCAVSLRGSYGPMEVANSIRGNDLLTDFFLFPEEVHALLEFSSKAVAWNIERQMEIVGPFHDGYITGFKSWIPGKGFGQISEDTSTLTGPETYRQFGLPYTRKSVRGIDKLFLHSHGLGEHSLHVIAELENLYMLEISNDPNSPRGIEIFKRNEEILADKIIVLNLSADEIHENMDFLKKHKTIIWYDAKTMEDAKSIVKLIRKELAVE